MYCSIYRYQTARPNIPKLEIPNLDISKPHCDLHNDDLLLNLSSRLISNHQLDTSRFFSGQLPSQGQSSGPTFTATDHASQFNFLGPSSSQPISSTRNTHSIIPNDEMGSLEHLSDAFAFSVVQIIFIVVDVIVLMYRCSRTYSSAKLLQEGFRETKVLEFHKGKAKEKLLIIHEHVLRQVAVEPSHNSHSTEEKELSSFEYTNNTNCSAHQYSTNDSHRRMLPAHQSNSTPQHQINTHVHHTNSCAATTTTTAMVGGTGVASANSSAPRSVQVTAIRDEDARKWTQKRRYHYFHVVLNIAQSNAVPKILIGVIVFLVFYVVVDVLYLALADGETLAELGAFQVCRLQGNLVS